MSETKAKTFEEKCLEAWDWLILDRGVDGDDVGDHEKFYFDEGYRLGWMAASGGKPTR